VIRVLVRGIATAIALSVIRGMLRGGRAGRQAADRAKAEVAGLEYAGFRRGAGGSGAWLATSAGLATLRQIRRMGERKREVVWSGSLTPGQKLVVRHLLEDRKGRPTG
jgi:hypothetical protein